MGLSDLMRIPVKLRGGNFVDNSEGFLVGNSEDFLVGNSEDFLVGN